MLNFDPISQDPPYDSVFPPHNISVQIPSAGENMLGVFFVAQGAGAHATIVLLHGFPGNEHNFDLAQIFRRAGWNVLVFHYRGAWGSAGVFSFTHVLEDTRAALDFVRNLPQVDTSRIVLMGHSMGAWSALMNTITDGQIMGAAGIGVWNISAFYEQMPNDQHAIVLQWLADSCAPLRVESAQALFDDIQANTAEWDLRRHTLTGRHVLLVAGAEDEDTPDIIHHLPLVRMPMLNSHTSLSKTPITLFLVSASNSPALF